MLGRVYKEVFGTLSQQAFRAGKEISTALALPARERSFFSLQPGSSKEQRHLWRQSGSKGAQGAPRNAGREEGAKPCTEESAMRPLFGYTESTPPEARGWVRPSLGLCMRVGRRAGNPARGAEECWEEQQRTAGAPLTDCPAASALPRAGSAGINTQIQEERGGQHPSVLYCSLLWAMSGTGPWYPAAQADKHGRLVGGSGL